MRKKLITRALHIPTTIPILDDVSLPSQNLVTQWTLFTLSQPPFPKMTANGIGLRYYMY